MGAHEFHLFKFFLVTHLSFCRLQSDSHKHHKILEHKYDYYFYSGINRIEFRDHSKRLIIIIIVNI